MRRAVDSGEEIARLLRRSEAGVGSAELCAEFGISRATLFRIRARYGLHTKGLSRILALERESRRARRRSRDLAAELRALQDLLRLHLHSLEERRKAVALLVSRHGLSERRSCDLVGLGRSALRNRETRASPRRSGAG
jgi:putative transposase